MVDIFHTVGDVEDSSEGRSVLILELRLCVWCRMLNEVIIFRIKWLINSLRDVLSWPKALLQGRINSREDMLWLIRRY